MIWLAFWVVLSIAVCMSLLLMAALWAVTDLRQNLDLVRRERDHCWDDKYYNERYDDESVDSEAPHYHEVFGDLVETNPEMTMGEYVDYTRNARIVRAEFEKACRAKGIKSPFSPT